MWKNIVEMNIIVGTYTTSLITGVMLKGVTGLDTELASVAVPKHVIAPLIDDDSTSFK
ncbi:hypothetical protein EI94DRAFT_1732910 [Lactarius quietus]|nr:hypothetical protein EI94DRAFT_1732910 [Lactarius quietus]